MAEKSRFSLSSANYFRNGCRLLPFLSLQREQLKRDCKKKYCFLFSVLEIVANLVDEQMQIKYSINNVMCCHLFLLTKKGKESIIDI